MLEFYFKIISAVHHFVAKKQEEVWSYLGEFKLHNGNLLLVDCEKIIFDNFNAIITVEFGDIV